MINIYYGPVVNPKTLTRYDALPQCLIAIGLNGNVSWIEEDVPPTSVEEIIAQHGLSQGDYNLDNFSKKPGQFIMPGLIDTHVHACQFPNLGIGGDNQLLDWLYETVFPTESKFENDDYARVAYDSVIDRSIKSGTTTSCYYGSLHLSATMILADIIHKKGQRAFVGKCNMDWNCPGYYIERTPEDSLRDTITLIEYIKSLSPTLAGVRLVNPIITPRFALSCSNKLLTKLGELAAKMPDVPIQTHISENRKEVDEAIRRFGTESYAEIYDKYGLLRNNTVLGHGVWLTEKEMKLIAERGAGVAHCPTSNFYLSSGMARVGLLLDYGVKVGLGTDVGGGYNPSILYTVQMASTASKMVAVQAQLDEERRQRRRAHWRCKRGKGDDWDRDWDHDRDWEVEIEAKAKAESYHEYGHGDVHEHQHHMDGRHDHHRADHHGGHGASAEAFHHDHHGGDREYHHCHGGHNGRSFANKKLDTSTLLYLATLGGAHVCAVQDRIGSFEVGKAFDALYVSLDDACGNPAVWGGSLDEVPKENEEDDPAAQERAKLRRWVERFLFTGDNRNVRKVWVQGELIGGEDKDVRARANDNFEG